MKSVTLGCKVSPEEKREVEQTARNLGMDKSGYLRARLFQGHEKIQQLSALPNDLIIAPQHADEAAILMEKLRNRYPNHHPSAILQGALSLALGNEYRTVSIKLKKYL